MNIKFYDIVKIARTSCNTCLTFKYEIPCEIDKNIVDELTYQPSGVLEAGFTNHVPKIKPLYEYLKKKSSLPDDTARIVFWVHVFGVQRDDIQQLMIIAPDGSILAKKEITIEENQARRLALIMMTLKSNTWPQGNYQGIYTLKRNEGKNVNVVIYDSSSLNVNSIK